MVKEELILGIETSCDDTGVSIIKTSVNYHDPEQLTLDILSNRLASQTKLHNEYGGVVPELASREHLRSLLPLTNQALTESGITPNCLSRIAVTTGPGLKGSLLTGLNFASGLAAAVNKPLIPVNHLEGHILSAFINSKSYPKKNFPFLTLLISGGHTQIILAKQIGNYELLGETIDDSIGETFDKVSQELGYSYPGGPIIEELAQQGNPEKYNFPKPLLNKQGLNLSFSGLKNAVIREIIKSKSLNENVWENDIAASLQHTISAVLASKIKDAIVATGVKSLVVSGGVAANKKIRETLRKLCQSMQVSVRIPPRHLCTDNGLMIAWAGGVKSIFQEHCYPEDLKVRPRWGLGTGTQKSPFC